MLEQIKAFLMGMREFRQSFTTSYAGHPNEGELSDAYDNGRELAHKLTFRHWDHA